MREKMNENIFLLLVHAPNDLSGLGQVGPALGAINLFQVTHVGAEAIPAVSPGY